MFGYLSLSNKTAGLMPKVSDRLYKKYTEETVELKKDYFNNY